jgi:Flp pilus assembly protein TadD
LSRLLWEKVPFFGLAVAVSVVTYVVQQQNEAVESVDILPLGARAGNALISYCRYLGKLFWPTDLAYFYPHPGYWPWGQVVLAGLLLAGISALVWAQRRRYPFLLLGWLWYVGTLVPVIGLVQVGLQSMADRYTYLPSLGVLTAVVWGVYELTRHPRYLTRGLPVAAATLILLSLALTRQQLGYWQDSESLFRHATLVTRNNFIAHNNLGIILDQKGQTGEAIGEFQEALRLKPDFADAHYDLALALCQKGQMHEAIPQFQEVLRLKPDDAEAHYNLAITLDQKGRTNEAIAQYQEALRLKPDNAGACNNLGLLWAARGQNLDQARALIQKAVALEPRNAAMLDSLAWVLLKQNQPREALKYQQQAIDNCNPPNAVLYDHLGDIYAALRQVDLAAGAWRKSLSLAPDPQIEEKLGGLSHF